MTEPVLTPIARHLRRLTGVAATEPDSILVARFTAERDQSAFAELVTRHGPMVLATCRRILGHDQDAEDAMQATFLVLAKKADAVRWQASIAGWLHAVAYRLAMKMRSRQARQKTAEGVSEMSAPPANLEADWDQVQAVIDDEIRRLPSEYAAVVLLCGVESVSTTVAAERLNLSEGAVRGRLYRGREMLRERLTVRGVSVSSAVLLTLLAQTSTGAAPTLAWDAVANAAMVYAMGQPVAGLVSGAVPELARRTLTTMFLIRTAPMALIGFLALATTTGAILFQRSTADASPQVPAKAVVANLKPDDKPEEKEGDPKKDEHEKLEGIVKKVEADKNVLVCEIHEENGKNEFRFNVASSAKVQFLGTPIAFTDAKPGMRVNLTVLKKTGLDIVTADLQWPTFRAAIKSADAAKGSLSVEIEDRNEEKFIMAFEVRKDSKILIDDIPAAIDDLAGTKAELLWSLDKKSFVGVDAEGDANDLAGWVKSHDATANTITIYLQLDGKHSRKVSLNLPLAADAKVRFLGKDAKLTELKAEMPVRVKLKADQRTIAGVWADNIAPKKLDDDE